MVSEGWLVTSTQSERERHQRSQKPVIRQKIPVGSTWQSWLLMAWHPRDRERKRQRHGGKGQEARVPTHT